jgi:hypothetical protein
VIDEPKGIEYLPDSIENLYSLEHILIDAQFFAFIDKCIDGKRILLFVHCFFKITHIDYFLLQNYIESRSKFYKMKTPLNFFPKVGL